MSEVKPKRLIYKNQQCSGKTVFAYFKEEFECVEFRKLEGSHPILHEPWIQFAPVIWDESLGSVFEEFVDLWNEKNATMTQEEYEKIMAGYGFDHTVETYRHSDSKLEALYETIKELQKTIEMLKGDI